MAKRKYISEQEPGTQAVCEPMKMSQKMVTICKLELQGKARKTRELDQYSPNAIGRV